MIKVRKAAEQELEALIEQTSSDIAVALGKEPTLIRPDEWKQSFIEAKSAWLAYCDTTCDLFWCGSIPGSGTGNAMEQRKFDMTIERIEYVD